MEDISGRDEISYQIPSWTKWIEFRRVRRTTVQSSDGHDMGRRNGVLHSTFESEKSTEPVVRPSSSSFVNADVSRKQKECHLFDRKGKNVSKSSSQLLLAHAARMSRLSLDLQMFKTDKVAEMLVGWKSFACAPREGMYVNRLVSVNTGLIATNHIGDELFIADDPVNEWRTLSVNSDLQILKLAALDGKCYSIMKDRRSTQTRIAIFDVRTGTWHALVTLEVEGVWQLIANESNLYLIGSNQELQVHQVDINEGRPHILGSIQTDAPVVSAVAIGDNIYTTSKSNSVTALSLNDFSTKCLPDTSKCNSSILNFGGRLVASGGVDESKECSASNGVEIFHSRLNKWLPLPAMASSRVGHGICATNDYSIAVVGGMNTHLMASAETLHV